MFFVLLLLADSSLYLLHNHSLHTDIITEMDFLGEGVRLQREREREREKGKGGEKESLFSIFSLITNQYISLWRPDHSVGRE